MLRINETEDPGNSEIEDEEEKVYHGPGYWRKGNHFHFGGRVQPVPPPTTSSPGAGRTGSVSDRLTLALQEQEACLDELQGKLQEIATKVLDDATRGKPLMRTGTFKQVVDEIKEREFVASQLREALSKMDEQEVKKG